MTIYLTYLLRLITPKGRTGENEKKNPLEQEETRGESSTFFGYREVTVKSVSQPNNIQVTTTEEPSGKVTEIVTRGHHEVENMVERSQNSLDIPVKDVVKIVQMAITAAKKGAGTEIREAIRVFCEIYEGGKSWEYVYFRSRSGYVK